jgi:hypothetical protein
MSTPAETNRSLQPEYTAAVARQRAEWELVTDIHMGPVERVIAYARWLAATERIKTLSGKLGGDEISGTPCPP